jgi:hypothetical protein
MIPLINLFLPGKIVLPSDTDVNQQAIVLQFIRQINGAFGDGLEADYIICSKPICISSRAIIMLLAWSEALFADKDLLCAQSFNPGPIKPISTKPQYIDRQIILRLADHIPCISNQN